MKQNILEIKSNEVNDSIINIKTESQKLIELHNKLIDLNLNENDRNV
jgi:hypothetical protein